jgi:NAD+ synthase (glutamine-hydrolysing)
MLREKLVTSYLYSNMAAYKIGAATLNQTPLDWKHNISNIKNALRQARKEQIDILCLPELCITGYGCEDLFLSNWLPKKAKGFIGELVNETENLFTTLTLPLYHKGELYNCAVIVSNKRILGVYAKQFMALDGVHYEPRWFKPWPRETISSIQIDGENYPFGDLTFEFKEWKIGFEICEDAWRGDDRPACRLFEQGVNLILNPSASHFAMQKTLERIDLVKETSKSFNCTYVFANLLGNEAGRMIYDGEILIAQDGELLLRNDLLSFDHFQVKHIDIEFGVQNISKTSQVILPDSKEEEFPKATSLAFFDYLRKSKSNGYVLSLSGGADSSTCAVLVAEMVKRGLSQLGDSVFLNRINKKSISAHSEKGIIGSILTTAYQATKNSSETTLNAAKTLSESIGAKFHQWNVDNEIDEYTQKIEAIIGESLTWENHDIPLQNIQARARSPIIWMLANINNSILLTTSNRSEGDLGYATMDGDTSGSLAPISSVDKPFIISWLKYAEEQLGYSGLKLVNSLKPTAELRPSNQEQNDEDDLMPYSIMVEIEKLAIRDHQSPLEVFKALRPKKLEDENLLKIHVKKFYRLWSQNQWKRERLAPAFHLDEFNVDPRTWCRFPILSSGFIEELLELDNF